MESKDERTGQIDSISRRPPQLPSHGRGVHMNVYRFVKLAEFLDIVIHERMKLTQIASWADPYEIHTLATVLEESLRNTPLFCPSQVASADQQQRMEALRVAFMSLYLRSMYAMCCTEKENSDAMWKVFAEETGVRLTIDADVLFAALRKERPGAERRSVYYYPTEKPVSEVVKEFKILEQKTFTFASCCFFKRDAFEHEKEYRFCDARFPDDYEEFIGPMESLAERLFEDEKAARFDGAAVDEMIGRIQRFTFPRLVFFRVPIDAIARVTLAPNCEWLEATMRTFLAHQGHAGVTVDSSALYRPPAR